MRSNAAPPETRSCDTCGGGRAASPTPALHLAPTGQQAPLSVQTFWPFAPGTSPCVHHLAVHLWPLYETTAPPVYAVDALHAGAVHVPPPGGGVVVPPPLHAPCSAQTSALPGVSPCVHHFAFQVCPL